MSDDVVRRLALRTLMPGFVGTAVPSWLEEALDDGLASLALYGTNVETPEQVAGLVSQLRARSPRLLVAVDEEGGDVTRLHYRTGSPYAGNAVLGRVDDVDVTRAEAGRIAAALRAAAIDLDLAPCLDVNSSDDNPVIGTRSFGADAALAARHGAAWVEGLQGGGVLACAKHFPGHGATTTDSHHALPVVDAPLDVVRARELVPFAAVAADVASVMVAHVVVPALDPQSPATFSSAVVQGVLRHELGFTGTVVTDALDMAGASADTGIPEAAVRALLAGCDLLCLGSRTDGPELAAVVDAVVAAVASGRLPLARLEDAADSVQRLAERRDRLVAAATPARAVGVPIARAFELSDRARAWLDSSGAVAVLQVGSASNLAVGEVPWGPASADKADPDPGDAPRVAVVGRDLGAGHAAWKVADDLRADGRDVVVVECGWPRRGSVRADIVTWGGSPAVSRVLVDLLRGRTGS